MKKSIGWIFALAALVAAAVALTPAAGAHNGDIWFQTAAKTAFNIEDKYPTVVAARCFPLPVSLRARYSAHSFVRNNTRWWDHFGCALAIKDGSTCGVVAHISGQEWRDFFLTSYPTRGCTPYQLRR